MNMSNHNVAIRPTTFIKLNGDNYLMSANEVRTYLIGQNNQKYLTGFASVPTDSNYEKWIQEDVQTRSLIWHSIEPTILGTIMYYNSTKRSMGCPKFEKWASRK